MKTTTNNTFPEWFESLSLKFSQANPHIALAREMQYDFPVWVIEKQQLISVLQFLKETAGFQFLTTLCTTHFPEQANREFCLMYQLHYLEANQRIRIKTYTSKEDTQIPSITRLFPAANWMERQEYDFFGIHFTGHPDLRRILNMDEMNYFPMRKEYPLEDLGRHDKNDAQFGR